MQNHSTPPSKSPPLPAHAKSESAWVETAQKPFLLRHGVKEDVILADGVKSKRVASTFTWIGCSYCTAVLSSIVYEKFAHYVVLHCHEPRGGQVPVFSQQHSCGILLPTKAACGVSIWWAHVIAHISAHVACPAFLNPTASRLGDAHTFHESRRLAKRLKSTGYSQTSQLSNGYWCKRIWKSANGQNSFRVAF